MKKNSSSKRFLLQDFAIILASIFIAIILVKTDILVKILTTTKETEFIGSFIAGMFFTSVFTTAPAIVTLGEIAQTNSIWSTALFGALGSVVGDLLIFHFVRDRFSEHMRLLFQHRKGKHRFVQLFKLRSFRWISFLVGGLIIASPFPDELGISLLGFSKLRLRYFIPLSFVFNFMGVVIIGGVSRLFS
jgi:hypothetical protein